VVTAWGFQEGQPCKHSSLAAWHRECWGTEPAREARRDRSPMQSMITTWEGGAMDRRRFLKLGMVMGGTIVLGECTASDSYWPMPWGR
jgi:hypothetical protein